MSKLQVKIDGEWQDLVKIEAVDYKNFEWGKDKTYVKEPLRSSFEVKGTIKCKLAVEKFADKSLAYLTEYAEKLGVEL